MNISRLWRILKGLGYRQYLNVSVLDRDTAQSVRCEEGNYLFLGKYLLLLQI